MEYVLVNDDCDLCRYISDAFTLLRLPLNKIQIADIESINIGDTAAALICPQIENQHSKIIDSVFKASKSSLIIFDATKKQTYTNKYVHVLDTLFSKYELKNALIRCANQKNDIPDFTDFVYPVFEKLIGQSKEICKIKSMIKQVAYSDTTVLILGQSGTGKDVIASCIHYLSDRKLHSLVPINCGAIPPELMESELFGHEKGAFTGALARRAGRFEIANEGTLFLDEIGDMPLPMQVKLLRVLQDRKITRVGSNTSIDVDVRLIAATNKNLEELIQSHQFREDLFYRLNVFPIHVPSLSERPEDIPMLIDFHLDKIHERLKHRVVFSEQAKEILCEYSWPGNIRELQNFLERMVILFPDQVVSEDDIDQQYKQKKLSSITTRSNGSKKSNRDIEQTLLSEESSVF